jgi:hypothetical protein
MLVIEQPFEFEQIQGFCMGGLKDYRGRDPMLIGFPPSAGTQAPTVPGFKSREIVKRHGRAQVVSPGSGETEKLGCHHGAYHVGACVIRAGAATTIPVETSKGFITTGYKATAQDILFFSHLFFHKGTGQRAI